MSICSYKDCYTVRQSYDSSVIFFRIPTDSRRQKWIENSGNKQLKNIGSNAVRYFCDKHFRPEDLMRQFNRSRLRKDAIPIPHPYPITEDDEEEYFTDEHDTRKNCETDTADECKNEVLTYYHIDLDESVSVDSSRKGRSSEEEEELTVLLNSHPELRESFNENIDIPTEAEEHLESEPLADNTTESELIEIEPGCRLTERLNLEVVTDENDELMEELLIPSSGAKRRATPAIASASATASSRQLDALPQVKRKYNTVNAPSDIDEDRHFALSLVGYFQRMPTQKKALAKLKILQYLTELEINQVADLK